MVACLLALVSANLIQDSANFPIDVTVEEVYETANWFKSRKSTLEAKVTQENVNSYIDEALRNAIKKVGNEYDPMKLADHQTGFSHTVLFVTVSAQAKLHSGSLTGLKSLHRTSNVFLDKYAQMRILTGNVGFKNLNFGYTAMLEAGVKLEVPVTATVESANIQMEAIIDTYQNTAKITKYILSIGKINVKYGNLGILSWISNPLTSFIVNIVRPVIVWAIEIPLKLAFEKELNNYISGLMKYIN